MTRSRWAALAFAAALAVLTGPAMAKSLYLIANINASPTPIRTYDIQGAPNYLVFQFQVGIPSRASGAVGMGIDSTSNKLFVTYENSNVIQLVDAVTFANLGTTTAPGASNLAGIVVDQGKSKVYTVDRGTNRLYVYSWNSAINTLTLDGGSFKQLIGVSNAHGLALDETRARLYVADNASTTIRYYDTNNFGASPLTEAGNVSIAAAGQRPQGIAVDQVRNLLYTGSSYPSFGSLGLLVKYDLNTNVVSSFNLRTETALSNDNVVGVAVDEVTGFIYISTGNQGSGGSDTLFVFDQNLVRLAGARSGLPGSFGDLGDPTGIAIPRADVSFNPLSFTKLDASDPVNSGQNLTYNLCFDNPNPTAVTNVTITDPIPAGTSFVSVSGGGVYDTVTNTVSWLYGGVAAGATICETLVVRVIAAGGSTLVNSATIDSNETPPTTRNQTTAVAVSVVCDVDSDGDIDKADLALISRARGATVPPLAPAYDANGDGLVSPADVKVCIPRCTRPNCATQ